MRRALIQRLRLLPLFLRQGWRVTLARFYGSVLYRWRLDRGDAQRLLIAPQDLRAADPTRAAEIVEGRFTFAGRTLEVEGTSPFAVAAPSQAWREMLFGFTWLRHLRIGGSVESRRVARQLVGDFVRSGAHLNREALDPATTARRILSWTSQAPLILDGAERGFHRLFLRSLIWQVRYLLTAGRTNREGLPRFLAAVAATQAALCLPDKLGLRRPAQRWLLVEIGRQILPDGVHVSRNPQAIIELLLDLLPLRQSYTARNLVPPQELLGAIDRLMPMLRFFRHDDGSFAAFNGMSYTQTHLVVALLAYDDARGKPVHNAPHGGYQRIEAGGSVLVADTGAPPPLADSSQAHAGALSIEFSADNCRILVNCGAPPAERENWRQMARATVAHSTASVDEASSCAFLEGEPLFGLVGRPIVSGPGPISVERRETPQGTWLSASHDGYLRSHGLVHRREIGVALADGALAGRDHFVDRHGAPWTGRGEVALRFHLHPAVTVEAIGGEAVALRLPGGRRWIFQARGGPLAVEESVHLANPEGPRRTAQIRVVYDPGASESGVVVWSLAPETAGEDGGD